MFKAMTRAMGGGKSRSMVGKVDAMAKSKVNLNESMAQVDEARAVGDDERKKRRAFNTARAAQSLMSGSSVGNTLGLASRALGASQYSNMG